MKKPSPFSELVSDYWAVPLWEADGHTGREEEKSLLVKLFQQEAPVSSSLNEPSVPELHLSIVTLSVCIEPSVKGLGPVRKEKVRNPHSAGLHILKLLWALHCPWAVRMCYSAVTLLSSVSSAQLWARMLFISTPPRRWGKQVFYTHALVPRNNQSDT